MAAQRTSSSQQQRDHAMFLPPSGDTPPTPPPPPCHTNGTGSIPRLRDANSFTVPVPPPPVSSSIPNNPPPYPIPPPNGQSFDALPPPYERSPTESKPNNSATRTQKSLGWRGKAQPKNKRPLNPMSKQLQRSIQARATVITHRNKLELERRIYSSRRYQHAMMRLEFIEACSNLVSLIARQLGDDSKLSANLLALQQDLESGTRALDDEDQGLDTLEAGLSRRDLKLIRLDTRQIDRENQVLKENDSSSDEESESSEEITVDDIGEDAATLSAHSASSKDMNPYEADYYDKIGDVNLAMEHIHNLDAGFQSSKYSRAIHRSTGGEPPTSDTDFLNSYRKERESLVAEYSEARRMVSAYYRLCHDQNIEVDEPNIAPIEPGPPLDLNLPTMQSKYPSGPSTLETSTQRPDILKETRVLAWSRGVVPSKPQQAVAMAVHEYDAIERLNNLTLQRSASNPGPIALEPIRGFPPDEPYGFLATSRPPSSHQPSSNLKPTIVEPSRVDVSGDCDLLSNAVEPHELLPSLEPQTGRNQARTLSFFGEKPARRYSDPGTNAWSGFE